MFAPAFGDIFIFAHWLFLVYNTIQVCMKVGLSVDQTSKKRTKRIFLIIFSVIILIAAVLFGFVWQKLGLIQYDDGTVENEISSDDISDENILSEEDLAGLVVLDGEPVVPDMEIYDDKNVVNILLIGTDERTKQFNTNARSDSMILISVNKEKDTVKLVSLERGMGVPVLSGQYEGQYDWLTHIFRYGGADLLMETVETCFRIKVDHYVRVNFSTLTQIVDSIGGVEISLTEAEASYMRSCDYDVKSGSNMFDGKTALFYSRIRKIDSDWGRVKRQRNVIQSAFMAAKNMSLFEINSSVNEILPLIQTNLTKGEIAALIIEAPSLVGKEMEQMTIPEKGTYGSMTGMGGRSLFAVDFTANAEILQEFLY